MHELTITRGPHRGSSVLLDPDSVCTIGSAADATLRVGAGPAEAAVVKALKGGGYGVKSLTDELRVNGGAVAVARLTPGDVLQVGDSEILYGEVHRGDGVPQRLGGFEILGILGQGGMGVVYRARQVSLDRDVALKVLSDERTADPKFIGSFQAEARHAARLQHPNVVQVFDVDEEAGSYFFSMELMEGGSVEMRMKREGRLSAEDAIAVIRDAAKGLAYAEQMRIVHRDIKPDNLMIDRHGHVKLADLGLAHAGEDDGGKVVGTPHFMSPEQILRRPMDHRSDLYSLGCTFFRLVTGQTPFSGSTAKEIVRGHVKDEAPRADEVNGEVSGAVADVIDRLIEKEPDDRYQSADELLADLELLIAPGVKRGPWVALTVVAVLVAGGALVWALTRPAPKDPERIIQVVDNPDAARQAEENRRLAADRARLAVLARRTELTDEQLAAELERVAKEHPDTPASGQATEQAADIRERLRLERIAAERLQRAVEGAVTALRTAYQQAVDAGDLPAAAGVLDGSPDDPQVAAAADLRRIRDELRADLVSRATAELASRRERVASAMQNRDPQAAADALAGLEPLVTPGTAWPDGLLGDGPEALRAWIDTQKSALANLQRELQRSREAAAWLRLRGALAADGGALQLARSTRLSAAADAFEAIASGAGDATGAAEHLRAMATASRRAARYLAAHTQRVADDGMDVPGGLPDLEANSDLRLRLVKFDGEQGARVEVRQGRRSEDRRLPLGELRSDPLRWFPPAPDADTGALLDHAAFLTVLGCSDQLLAAITYLGDLDVADDASGTGEEDGFTLGDDPLRLAAEALRDLAPATGTQRPAGEKPAAPDPATAWVPLLRTELSAMRTVGQALRAFSARRNLTAAGLTEQLIERHGDTVTVSLLL